MRDKVYAIAYNDPKLLRVFIAGLNLLFDPQKKRPWEMVAQSNGFVIQHKGRTIGPGEFYKQSGISSSNDGPTILIQDKYLCLFIEYSKRLDKIKEEGDREYNRAKQKFVRRRQSMSLARLTNISSAELNTIEHTNIPIGPHTVAALKKKHLVTMPPTIQLTVNQISVQQVNVNGVSDTDFALAGPQEHAMMSDFLMHYLMKQNQRKVELMSRLQFLRQQEQTVIAEKEYTEQQIKEFHRALKQNVHEKEQWLSKIFQF